MFYFYGKTVISAAPPPFRSENMISPSLWVIQQVFGASDSSRKRWNKYFIFHLLKNNEVCNRVLAGAQSCLNQICDSK